MTISELLRNVASLVDSRETIDHGYIRCLWAQEHVDSICAAEGCDEVGTGMIGDDDLAAELAELAGNGDRIADLDLDDLAKLADAYRGDSLGDYIQSDREDELGRLDALIDAAREIV